MISSEGEQWGRDQIYPDLYHFMWKNGCINAGFPLGVTQKNHPTGDELGIASDAHLGSPGTWDHLGSPGAQLRLMANGEWIHKKANSEEYPNAPSME